MPNKNPQKAFVLDPRTLLAKDFDERVVQKLQDTYFNRASETQRHPTHPEESKVDEAVALDEKRLSLITETGRTLNELVKQSTSEDGRLDWVKLTKRIREKIPLFDGSVVQDCVKEVFRSSETPLLDLDSLRQLEEKGKIIFILGNENGPAEELVNTHIRQEIQKVHANEKVKMEEIGINHWLLKDAVRDNGVLFIKTGEHGNANRPDKVLKVAEVLSGLKLDPVVVDTELKVLGKVKEGSTNKKLREGTNSLFIIGPDTRQIIPYGIRRAESLKQFLIKPPQQEGQVQTLGVPAKG